MRNNITKINKTFSLFPPINNNGKKSSSPLFSHEIGGAKKVSAEIY